MYCEKCGSKKNENGICPKCGVNNNVNVITANNTNNDDNWVVFTVLKCIFIPFGISVLVFFITTILSVFVNILVTGSEEYSSLSGETSVIKSIFSIIQIGLPILILLFGWIVILLIDLKKHKKK